MLNKLNIGVIVGLVASVLAALGVGWFTQDLQTAVVAFVNAAFALVATITAAYRTRESAAKLEKLKTVP